MHLSQGEQKIRGDKPTKIAERERLKRLTLLEKSRAGQQEKTSKLTEQHSSLILPSDLVGLNTSGVGSLQEEY